MHYPILLKALTNHKIRYTAILCREHVILDVIMMFVVCQTITLSYMLDHHNKLDFQLSDIAVSEQTVAPLGYFILIGAIKSLFLLLNAVCLAEKQQTPMLYHRYCPNAHLYVCLPPSPMIHYITNRLAICPASQTIRLQNCCKLRH